tara:strand:+ start:774 stop:1199 length:426 start_codon:yes stop_codon:yes gene_type:complete
MILTCASTIEQNMADHKTDRLSKMFELRKAFMRDLSDSQGVQKDGASPIDLSLKSEQRHLRDVSLRGVEEVFEALSELRNSKSHRQTEILDFDRDKFLEEWVDAFNYFFSVLILAGYTEDEFFEMYKKKDEVIHERLKNGY